MTPVLTQTAPARLVLLGALALVSLASDASWLTPQRATAKRKVRSTVNVGPPDWTKSRTFILVLQLAL